MGFKNYKIYNTLIIIVLFFSSCASDLDFDQVKDLKLEPVFVANLTYFDVPANAFVINGVEQRIAFDDQNFDVFKNEFFKDNLKKAEFNFEITNTIDRSFKINLILLGSDNSALYTMNFDVPANTSNISYAEVFENQKLELLKSTTKIGFVITLQPGTPLTEDSLGSLKLRSSATVYLEIK